MTLPVILLFGLCVVAVVALVVVSLAGSGGGGASRGEKLTEERLDRHRAARGADRPATLPEREDPDDRAA